MVPQQVLSLVWEIQYACLLTCSPSDRLSALQSILDKPIIIIPGIDGGFNQGFAIFLFFLSLFSSLLFSLLCSCSLSSLNNPDLNYPYRSQQLIKFLVLGKSGLHLHNYSIDDEQLEELVFGNRVYFLHPSDRT